jgi:hypothetical protein
VASSSTASRDGAGEAGVFMVAAYTYMQDATNDHTTRHADDRWLGGTGR